MRYPWYLRPVRSLPKTEILSKALDARVQAHMDFLDALSKFWLTCFGLQNETPEKPNE